MKKISNGIKLFEIQKTLVEAFYMPGKSPYETYVQEWREMLKKCSGPIQNAFQGEVIKLQRAGPQFPFNSTGNIIF